MMMTLLQDASFWTALCFVLFVILVAWKGAPAIRSTVDGRILRIRGEIENAQNLREQSEALLGEMNTKLKLAERESKAIIDQAEKQALQIEQNALEKLEALIERKQAQASEYQAHLQHQAEGELKAHASRLAIAGARAGLAGVMGREHGDQIFQQALQNISGALHRK